MRIQAEAEVVRREATHLWTFLPPLTSILYPSSIWL
jgi:hypothetical protein